MNDSTNPSNTAATPDEHSWFALNSWVFSQIATIFHATFLLYCMLKLYQYGRRKGKWQLKWNDRQRWLMTLAIVTPLMTMGRVVLTQAVIIIGKVAPLGPIGDFACEIDCDLSVVFFYLSGEFYYIFEIKT